MSLLRLLARVLALTVLCAAPLPTFAQTGPLIIDQNRSDRRPPAPKPTLAQPPAGRVVQKVTSFVPFTLREVQIDGASAITGLNAVSHPFIGKRMDSAGLNHLADAVAAAFAKTDVALYTVVLPAQTFKDGLVRLKVVQGYVAEVRITGQGSTTWRDIVHVRALADHLKQDRPLRRSTLERSLSLIRDTPGLTADMQMLRAEGPGAVRLDIALKRKVFSVGVGVNDRGTAQLGRTQVEIDFKANGLFRPGDMTQLTLAFPTDIQRFQYIALAQTEPIGDQGLTATANVGYLRTHPLSVDVRGSAVTGGLQLSYPVIRSYTQTLNVTGSFDGVNSSNALFGQILSDERTRALRAAASYSKAIDTTSFNVSLTASLGVDGLGARVADSALSNPSFKKLNMRAALDRQISPQWVVRLRSEAQYTSDRLPATEQLSLGGPEFGRAFESSAVVGDAGVAASAEVAWRPTVLPSKLKGSELYAFLDGGKLWQKDRPSIPGQSHDLSSTGVGVRVPVFGKTVVEVEADHALKSPYSVQEDNWRLVLGFKTAV